MRSRSDRAIARGRRQDGEPRAGDGETVRCGERLAGEGAQDRGIVGPGLARGPGGAGKRGIGRRIGAVRGRPLAAGHGVGDGVQGRAQPVQRGRGQAFALKPACPGLDPGAGRRVIEVCERGRGWVSGRVVGDRMDPGTVRQRSTGRGETQQHRGRQLVREGPGVPVAADDPHGPAPGGETTGPARQGTVQHRRGRGRAAVQTGKVAGKRRRPVQPGLDARIRPSRRDDHRNDAIRPLDQTPFGPEVAGEVGKSWREAHALGSQDGCGEF